VRRKKCITKFNLHLSIISVSPGFAITLFIVIAGLALFFYIIYKRYVLLRSAKPDLRFDSLGKDSMTSLSMVFSSGDSPAISGLAYYTS